MTSQNLLVELLVEELPPKALKKLGDAFAQKIYSSLSDQRLIWMPARSAQNADQAKLPLMDVFASPRRLGVLVRFVLLKAPDVQQRVKLMPVAVGLDASGKVTLALVKKLQALGADVSDPAKSVAALKRALDGKVEFLFYDSLVTGATLDIGLQKALEEALAKLPIPKVMSYQLETDCELPGWSSVHFVRPAHGLVALHGSTVVPVKVLGLKAGNSTQGHRFEAKVSPVVIADADSYAATLAQDGAVIASFAERRANIARQLAAAAAQAGDSHPNPSPTGEEEQGGALHLIDDESLLDEVTGLVERPNVLVCQFESQFLEIPQECLILTMKANQKYFPLLDSQGKLSNKFLVVSNINPVDASAVIGGNERVVRPRLADAKFFFDQDRKKTLASRVAGLDKVVYHNKLGTQGERSERVRTIAVAVAGELFAKAIVRDVETAARLAKTDLLTDMVGEFPELQGIMGGYYARHDGLSEEIAFAIEDHYKPRFAGDELPRNKVGLVLALADKLETLVGMFGIGNLPTGDKDPFALRRHALGVVRLLTEWDLSLDLNALVAASVAAFGDKITDASAALIDFIFDRLAGSLREQGYSAQEVDAVLALRPQRLGDVAKRLVAVRAFAALPEAAALAAANKRIGNILKKALDVDSHVSKVLLKESAEIALFTAMEEVAPKAKAQFDDGDYTASLQTLAALRAPVDAFFDDVMVNVEAVDLRLNRLGLLKNLHLAMNRVADLSKLAA